MEPEEELTIAPEEDEELPEDQEEPEEESEFSIELEGEVAEEETPLIRQLREQNRDQSRELAEYRKQAMPKIEVGKEPDLWDDCDGDPDKYKTELLAWTDRKRRSDNQEAEATQQAQVRNQQVQRRFAEYQAASLALPVKDFKEVEELALADLPYSDERPIQQMILNYAKEPAKVMYALGKHPAKRRALIDEPDMARVLLLMTEFERNLKVTTRKAPPPPEGDTIQRGSAPNAPTKATKAESAALEKGDQKGYRAARKARMAKTG